MRTYSSSSRRCASTRRSTSRPARCTDARAAGITSPSPAKNGCSGLALSRPRSPDEAFCLLAAEVALVESDGLRAVLLRDLALLVERRQHGRPRHRSRAAVDLVQRPALVSRRQFRTAERLAERPRVARRRDGVGVAEGVVVV